MVGVLDAGVGAIASHGTAAALWQLPGFAFEPVEVTRGGRRTSRTPPVAIRHRPLMLSAAHHTATRGVPITSLARTVFDLAGRLHEQRLARLVNMVANRSPGTLVALHRTLAELGVRGRPGIQVMRAVLADRPVGSVLPASGLEMRFETILVEGGQAPLRRQVDLGGHEWIGRVDFHDAALGLVVEVDSILHHTSPVDVAHDELRDQELLAAGFRKVVRVPEEHIWYQPHLALDAVRQARRDLAVMPRCPLEPGADLA
jgi:very-short-patch-repair endonuclease